MSLIAYVVLHFFANGRRLGRVAVVLVEWPLVEADAVGVIGHDGVLGRVRNERVVCLVVLDGGWAVVGERGGRVLVDDGGGWGWCVGCGAVTIQRRRALITFVGRRRVQRVAVLVHDSRYGVAVRHRADI